MYAIHSWTWDWPWEMVCKRDWFYMVNTGWFASVFYLHVRVLGVRSFWCLYGFQQKWWEMVDEESSPSNNIFISIMTWAELPQIDRAIEILAAKRDIITSWNARMKYFYGVLHNLATEESETE